MNRLSYNYVKQFLFKKSIILLSNEYINNKTKLKCQCLTCNNVWAPVFHVIQSGRGCPLCAINKRKFSYEYVKQFFLNKNIKLLSEEYMSSNKNLQCKCLTCNHVWFCHLNRIQQGNGCPVCAKENRKQTMLKRYGVEYPQQSKEIRNKSCKTYIKKYGVENPLQNNEIKEKKKQTCLKRYGVDSPLKNKDIASKQAKSSNNSYILYHWKTGKEIICRGSWEKKTAEDLNNRKINYEWQPGPFTMPDGTTYTPDLLLTDQNLYIEIKGYKRPKNMKKWNWFHSTYPNSELWDKKKLKEAGIL